MSKESDLNGYRQSGEDVDGLYKFVMDTIHEYFGSIDKAIESLSEEDIIELTEYFRYFLRKHNKDNFAKNIGLDRIKILFLLFSKLSDSIDAYRVLTYLESVEFGWHGNKYILNNPCLREYLYKPMGHCKKPGSFSYTESAADALDDVLDIFFNNECSPIMLFVFNYCLASGFTSMLNAGGISMPFFLQIAVDKTSVVYQVLKEVVEICDVNAGLIERCNKRGFECRRCSYNQQIYYPTQSVTKDIDNLVYNFKDGPVLIVGHESERSYAAILREIVNIPTKKKALDLRDRFSLLPVFVCPAIRSSFDNVFDLDLTNLEVSTEYLTLIRSKKKMLASWVLKLVTEADESLFQQMEEIDKRKIARDRSLISSMISPYINQVCQKYSYLTLDNAKNVGCLNFFFKRYLNVFERLCTFPPDEKFEVYEGIEPTLQELITILTDKSEQSLAQLHHRYLPAPKETGIKNKDAVNLAKRIEKCYRELKVYIRVIPSELKADRYIFMIDTLNETKDVDISRNAQTVQHRLKKYEYFRIDLRDQTKIKLIVAVQPLADNSLIEILTHKDFTRSKLAIPYAVGFDDTGAMCIEDIAEFPHLLLGGATRSGKSTAIMSLLVSIAYRHRTGDVNVMILDLLGKEKSDFDMFNGQQFMSAPVITEPDAARKAILLLREEKIRRLQDGNLPEMPYVVCVIDEFSKLYSGNVKKEYADQVKDAMDELLSSGRHAKIHLVLALQNPRKEDMGDSIVNNTAKIAMKCGHFRYSIAILGRAGAEKLVGRGQMIFDSSLEKDRRLQGAYISPKDAKELLCEIDSTFKQRNKYPFILKSLDEDSMFNEQESNAYGVNRTLRDKSDDDILLDAIMWSLPQEKIANSRLQAKCQIGNNRANRVLERMEEMGLILRMHGNLGWKTIPRFFEDVSLEAVNFLKGNGVTEAEIRNILSKRSDEADIKE